MKRWIASGCAAWSRPGLPTPPISARSNPYTKTEAAAGQGAVRFPLRAVPSVQHDRPGAGNYPNEPRTSHAVATGDPSFSVTRGGDVPPLIGEKYFETSQKREQPSVVEWGAIVSSAAQSFPPDGQGRHALTPISRSRRTCSTGTAESCNAQAGRLGSRNQPSDANRQRGDQRQK